MFFVLYGMQIWIIKNYDFFVNFTIFLTFICKSFMDETIDILINLQVWNLTDATYDTYDIWHMTYDIWHMT